MPSPFSGRRALIFVPLLAALLAGYSFFKPPASPPKTYILILTPDVSRPEAAGRTTHLRKKRPAPTAQSLPVFPTATTNIAQAKVLAATPTQPAQPGDASTQSLANFVREVSDGHPEQVRGLYVDGVLALRVVQQPQGDSGYISAEDGTATQFQDAARSGVTGLLAHNFLSGGKFFNLVKGQSLRLIFGDGHQQSYRISQIDDYQRLSVTDLRSDFRDLQNGAESTADEVFNRYYRGAPHLILQTCIERNGEWTWGVRFIRAEPAG